MTRRNFFHLTAYAAALPGGAPFWAGWLQAAGVHGQAHNQTAPAEPGFLREYKPRFFDPADFEALKALTEILIPTDETPGAREAHCAAFIDFVLHASAEYDPATGKRWRQAITALKRTGFHSANAKGRSALVEAMSRPERDRSVRHPAFAAYRLIKRENAFAFYTSRAGLIEALDYRGNSYNPTFPACNHPEHHVV